MNALVGALPPGCYPGMPEEHYRAAHAVANSDLKYIQRSPAHFYAARLDPDREPEVDTAVKVLGRALHCAILEPHTFDQRFYCVDPDAPRDARHHRNAKAPSAETLASIRWWDDFTARNDGKQLVDRSASDKLRKVGARVRQHPELQAYLRTGTAEDSIFAVHPEFNLPVKIRTDWRTQIDGLRVVIDVKSCEDARPEAFARDAWKYGYFQGAAWYCDVHEWAGLGHVDLYLLLALEKAGPGIKIYEVQEDVLEIGREQHRKAMALYAHCKAVGEWPSYSTDIEPLVPPSWAKP
jgi:Phage tail sheath protein FI